jgi:methionyl-tRNA formyltransferase
LGKNKILLFAMTGFGNNAFSVLLKMRNVELVAVFTPKRETAPFPYYECVPLQDVVLRHKRIQFFEDVSLRTETAYQMIEGLSPDLIVVGTFNQIIPQKILSIPRLGVINLHPSLLPKYRGGTPTVWVLINGEKETGITVHFIEDERIDRGRIIIQSKLKIHSSDSDGTLRHRLAIHSEKVLEGAIRFVFQKRREKFRKQNEFEASYYRKRTIKDAEINLSHPFEKIRNQIRAMTPYPGAYLKHNGLEYLVRGVSRVHKNNTWEHSDESTNKLFLPTANGIVRFDAKKKFEDG